MNGRQTVRIRKGFVGAVDFVHKIVPIAEEMDHHPDVRIFAYKRVEISISTHSVGAITEKDFELARKIEAFVS
jgi:4a-hydroxytetrahydrobiopterin dehydratase